MHILNIDATELYHIADETSSSLNKNIEEHV